MLLKNSSINKQLKKLQNIKKPIIVELKAAENQKIIV